MTTSLSQRQSLIRAAIARLEAGADVPADCIETAWTRDELLNELGYALADHDDEGCPAIECGHECWAVDVARSVLGEPEDGA